MNKIALFFLICTVCASCAPDPVDPIVEETCAPASLPITDITPMIGKWAWCNTITLERGSLPDTLLAEDVGIELLVTITSNKEAIVYHGTTQMASYPFSLRGNVTSEDMLFEVLNPASLFSPNIEMAGLIRIEENRLSIIGNYDGSGGNQTFTKVE